MAAQPACGGWQGRDNDLGWHAMPAPPVDSGRQLLTLCTRPAMLKTARLFHAQAPPYAAQGPNCQQATALRLRMGPQVCFDFMRGFDGVLRCTECNPRASAVMASLHNQPEFATALASPEHVLETALPTIGSPGQVCISHEVLCNMPQGRFRDAGFALLTGRDAVLSASDPCPFIMLHLLQVPPCLWFSCFAFAARSMVCMRCSSEVALGCPGHLALLLMQAQAGIWILKAGLAIVVPCHAASACIV